jgi:hypothetical protein
MEGRVADRMEFIAWTGGGNSKKASKCSLQKNYKAALRANGYVYA